MLEETTTGVTTVDAPDSQPQGDVAPPATVETSDSQPSVTGSEAQGQTVQEENDPFKDVPDLETLRQQAEQKLPNAEALYRIRSAYEAHKAETEPLMAWKEVANQFADPSEVLSHRELISKIHSPVPDRPGGFTTQPFLADLEAQSPGTVEQMLIDALSFAAPNETGQMEPLSRQLLRAWKLDPDRLDDYRQIDSRAPAGVVTQDQLSGIDQKYHNAFKALSPAQREDILLQRDSEGNFPTAVMDYLQDKAEALEAREWREQNTQREQQEQQAKQQAFERKTSQAVDADISQIRREMYDSIHKTLADQWKPSTDETQNAVEYAKVLGILPALLYPEFSFVAENALKQVGVSVDAKFTEIAGALAGAREEFTRYTRQGDQMRARGALSRANLAQAQLNTKLSEYALALANPSAQRLQAQSQTTVNSLKAAAARVVPTGTVQSQNGGGNPYDANPYQLGTPEYRSWNKNMDKQMGLNSASGLTA
jgi:hypothetical protein